MDRANDRGCAAAGVIDPGSSARRAEAAALALEPPRRRSRRWRLVAAGLALAASVPALSLEVAGVKVPDTLAVGDRQLALNGAGLRKKWIVKVYVGALYLPAPAHDAEGVLAADEPRAVRMSFLHEVTVYQMMNAFREGFDANASPDEAKKLKVALRPVEGALVDLKPGMVLVVSYAPGVGSSVQVEGHPPVVVPGKDFGDALFRNWIGAHPADADLKKGLLGG